MTEKYPGQFLGVAAVSLRDLSGVIYELDRAVRELGLRGVQVFTNVQGKQLYNEAFYPLYEKAIALDVPVLILPPSL